MIKFSVLLALAIGLSACGDPAVDAPFVGDNDVPIARLSAPVRITVGEPVLFDGSASEDPDGVIEEYWFIPGDASPTLQSASAALYHTYTQPGEVTIQLIVLDEFGSKATDRVQALVVAR